jgi:hypothetical protein
MARLSLLLLETAVELNSPSHLPKVQLTVPSGPMLSTIPDQLSYIPPAQLLLSKSQRCSEMTLHMPLPAYNDHLSFSTEVHYEGAGACSVAYYIDSH